MSIESLDKRVEVWGNIKVYNNELKEWEFEDSQIKTIWACIIPQTGSLQKQQANTILSNVTNKIKIRYGAGKDITEDMWFVFENNKRKHRYDIKYILNPYFSNDFLEIFCEEKIGG
jgi:SPP1 family predicted phage head-tail adaptor